MRAIRFDGEQARLEGVDFEPRPGEAVVKVRSVGVCNTDLEILRGYAGFRGTLGHEFVGEVVEARDESLVGKRVVGEINCGCGVCELCVSGDPRHCPDRTVLGIVGRDGAMADFMSLPEGNLLVVPDRVPDRHAVFVEPLAAACEILDQVAIGPGSRVAVVGDGKLGLLIAQVVATTGADMTVVGKHAGKLEILAARGIRTALVDVFDAAVRFDVVVEASGSARGFAFAQRIVRPRGTIVLKSTIHGDVPFDATSLIVNEVTLVGSRCGRFGPALDLIASGRVDVEPLVSRVLPLSAGASAFDVATEPGVLKVILETAM